MTPTIRQGVYHCRQCDKPIRADDNYCSECGEEIDWKTHSSIDE